MFSYFYSMKPSFNLIHLLFLIILGCGNPGEQQANREKLIEGLDDHKIKRVTEDQIISAAYEQGNQIVDQLSVRAGDTLSQISISQSWLDSLSSALNHQEIKLITPETPVSALSEYESALFDAYQFSARQGQVLKPNVQTVGDQFLLYTYPLEREQQLLGMWSILLSRKTLIRKL